MTDQNQTDIAALLPEFRRALEENDRRPRTITGYLSDLTQFIAWWQQEHEDPDDELVVQQVGVRGALSLEHTFRMLSLVLDPEPVRAAFQGILLDDDNLKGYALEFLEQALPADVRRRLWTFIGDVSEHQRRKALRSLDEVASDLMATRATLFADAQQREALRKMLDESQSGPTEHPAD